MPRLSINFTFILNIQFMYIQFYHNLMSYQYKDLYTVLSDSSLSLCNQQTPSFKWCTYEATDNNTIIIQQFYLAAIFILTFFICRYLCKMIQYQKQEQQSLLLSTGTQSKSPFAHNVFLQVFLIVILWIVFSLARVIVNITVYYLYMKPDFDSSLLYSPSSDRQINEPIVILSNINTFFDFICSFLINLLILLIPYQWLKIILLSTSQKKLITFQFRKTIYRFFKVLFIVEVYLKYLRTGYLIILLMEPFLFFYTDFAKCQYPKFNYFWVVCQSLLILFFYFFGFYLVGYMKNNRLVKIKKKDQERVRIQYGLLMICLIFRILLNFYFRLSPFYQYKPNFNCSESDPNNKTEAAIFLSLHHSFMHMLPIITIIYIYRPNSKQRRSATGEDQQTQNSLKTNQQEQTEVPYERIRKFFYNTPFTNQIQNNHELKDGQNLN